MSRDLRNDWQGRVWALRRLPRHVTLSTPTDWRDVCRVTAWLVVRSVVIGGVVGAVAVLLALAAGRSQ